MKMFDLEERTTKFAKAVIKLCKTLRRDPINDRLVGQLIGAAGSIGANYREANDSLGKKEEANKYRKEVQTQWKTLEPYFKGQTQEFSTEDLQNWFPSMKSHIDKLQKSQENLQPTSSTSNILPSSSMSGPTTSARKL